MIKRPIPRPPAAPTHDPGAADEVRQHRRVALEVAVSLESEHNFYAGVANNVSEGGVFVATQAPLPRGARVSLTLALPETGHAFALTGVVRWVREHEVCDGVAPGCGIAWQDLPDDARGVIEAFVRARDTILYDLA